MECVTLGCQLEKKLQVQFYSGYVGIITIFYVYESNSEATNYIADSFLTIPVWKIPQGILFSVNVKPNFKYYYYYYSHFLKFFELFCILILTAKFMLQIA